MNANTCQQILGIDVQFSNLRFPNDTQRKTEYIRRRSQLLRDVTINTSIIDPTIRKNYLISRSKLLAMKYGPISDNNSVRSYSLGSIDKQEILSSSVKELRKKSGIPVQEKSEVNAEASLAMAGGNSISENYAFAGMYHIFDNHLGCSVTAVKFANDDKGKLAFSSLDGQVSVCSMFPTPKVSVTLNGHREGITDFAWSLSNDLIVTASMDTTLRLWNANDGQCVRVVAETRTSSFNCCVFQPLNNNFVVAGDSNAVISAYNISTGKQVKDSIGKLGGAVLSIDFDSSGALLWGGDNTGTIYSFIFDISTGKLTKGHRLNLSTGHPVTSVQARSWISREARDPSVLVNVASNKLCLFRVVDAKGLLQLNKTFFVKHQTLKIKSAFCPLMSLRQGACVVTGGEDMSVRFFNIVKTGIKSAINKLQGHAAPVLDVAFNYDESLLASCDSEGIVIIWRREGKHAD